MDEKVAQGIMDLLRALHRLLDDVEDKGLDVSKVRRACNRVEDTIDALKKQN